jgi:NAD(P)-dependent dehydrogenase (short-subunit alcohol dehydrogenase family)
MKTLEGRVAIVTGGTRGIGHAYTLGLAGEGASVMVADVQQGDEVVRDVEKAGGSADWVKADVTDPASVEAMAKATTDRFGKIDILVNNAAIYTTIKRARFDELDVDEWERVFAVNVRGPWLCVRAVYPYMKARGYGKIINVSSTTVFDGTPNFVHYVAGKAAVIGLSRALAREMGDDHISVNTVTPDYTPHDSAYASTQPHLDEILQKRRCFKRTQVPEDMVPMVVFLAGPGSDFITGQNFLVNGGGVFQ